MGVVSGLGDPESSQNMDEPQNSTSLSRRVYRFGSFELRTETGELSKRGIRLRLQAKPLHILEALLAQPGELVRRETLCNRLWPGTYVDFESGLNTAVNRLRGALGDSADSPRYIETLPRLGYRFISPVEVIEETDPVPAELVPSTQSAAAQTLAARSSPPAALESRLNSAQHPFLKPLSLLAAAGLAAASILGFAYLRPQANTPHPQPKFQELTFRSGRIDNARFSPGPGKVVYTARWRPGERGTYLLDLTDGNSRILPFVSGTLEAVSSRSDLLFASAKSLRANSASALLRVPIAGGKAQIIAEQSNAADLDRSGQKLAIVRQNGSASSVEFPPGHVIYKSAGWISSLRIAPCGTVLAFLEHPISDDDAGYVRIARLNGTSRLMTGEWSSIDGLAWSPSGGEIWFTASKTGGARSLYAVSDKAVLRRISNSPLSLRVLDISTSGRTLVSLDNYRVTMMAALPGSAGEADLSKYDFSFVEDISSDGKLVLFTEGGDGGGRHYTAFVYNQQSHETLRVGAGRGVALSPDGKSVLLIDPEDRSMLTLMPIGASQPKKISGAGFQYQWARFAGRDGKMLLVGGSYGENPLITATQRVDHGKPTKLDFVPYMDHVAVSRDGLRLAGVTPNGDCVAVDVTTGKLQNAIPRSAAVPVAWSADGQSLFVLSSAGVPGDVLRVNVKTGEWALWKSVGPKEVTGFVGLANAVAVPELNAYAYSAAWELSRLYVVDGWS